MNTESNKPLLVISGGTKGIGRALINKFVAEGFSIATCSRHAEDLDALKKSLEATVDTAVITCEADLSTRAGVEKFSQSVMATGIVPEVLINNSGRFIPGEILKEDEGVMEETMATNLHSAYHLTRALVPSMKASRRGHVFNMCSTASQMAFTNGGSYCISKFAMYGMSKVLREELKPYGVRVTSVMPGPTLTASWEGVEIPADRFIDPVDVAELVYSTYRLSSRTVVEDIVIRPQLGDL